MTARQSLAVLIATAALAACAPDKAPVPALRGNTDAAFAAVQERGKDVMGVDQYTSQHVFEDLPDGGRIVLERDDASDTTAIAQIRTHMREILADFTAGDFSKPFGVHAQQVPGTDVMTARRDMLRYEVSDRPRGAELRITTNDAAAFAAVRSFLAFQRMDHRAMGHGEHDDHAGH